MPEHNLPKAHIERLVASSLQYDDVVTLFKAMIAEVSDVRTNIGSNDTLEIRRALQSYLQEEIDTLARVRNSRRQQPGDAIDDVV